MQTFSNFHTHTARCKHALGEPKDYFLQAQKDGCSALGFSDHCPYPDNFPDVWQGIRMAADELLPYVADVRSVSEGADFPVYLGFECEWDKDFAAWYSDVLLGEAGADYLAFGPHWVTKGRRHIYAPEIDNEKDLHLYVDQMIEGMRSGLYAFVAHPDLFMAYRDKWGDDEIACFEAIIDAAEDLGLPLEVNGLGMARPMKRTKFGDRFAYPHDEFWERVAGRNVKVVCNSDSHNPIDVVEGVRRARVYAEKFGLAVVESIF